MFNNLNETTPKNDIFQDFITFIFLKKHDRMPDVTDIYRFQSFVLKRNLSFW